MSIQTTYSNARAQLATLLDEVIDNKEVVIIRRRGSADVALVAADELASLQETAHLLRSPKSAERVFAALERAQQQVVSPQTLDDVRHEVELGWNG